MGRWLVLYVWLICISKLITNVKMFQLLYLFGFLISCTIYTNILVLCRCDLSLCFCFVLSDQTYETWSDSSHLINCNWTFVLFFEKLQLQFWCKVVIKFIFRVEPGFGKTLYCVCIFIFTVFGFLCLTSLLCLFTYSPSQTLVVQLHHQD